MLKHCWLLTASLTGASMPYYVHWCLSWLVEVLQSFLSPTSSQQPAFLE